MNSFEVRIFIKTEAINRDNKTTYGKVSDGSRKLLRPLVVYTTTTTGVPELRYFPGRKPWSSGYGSRLMS